jgi:hypothetical protein
MEGNLKMGKQTVDEMDGKWCCGSAVKIKP